jgi:hypothetical protein
MINIVILNKNSYEVLIDKSFHKQNHNYKEYSQIFNTNIINIIKNLDETSNAPNYIIKLDNKAISYRRSSDTFISIFCVCEKKSYKKDSLTDISRVFLDYLEAMIHEDNNIIKNNKFPDFKIKEILNQIVSDITIKFIEFLRKNKIYSKFIYFNYNINVSNFLNYKKTKIDSTSVILQTNKESEKM